MPSKRLSTTAGSWLALSIRAAWRAVRARHTHHRRAEAGQRLEKVGREDLGHLRRGVPPCSKAAP